MLVPPALGHKQSRTLGPPRHGSRPRARRPATSSRSMPSPSRPRVRAARRLRLHTTWRRRMTDPQQKLEARITQVNQHWKDQRPHELFRRIMVQPLIGEAMCALGDTIIDALTHRRYELVALRVGALRENAY